MPIVGFGFDKINVEKKAQLKQEDKVQNNIRIISLKDAKLKISDEEKEALTILFEFSVDYSDAGKLELQGHIIYFDNPEKINELLDHWKENEKVPTDFGNSIYNFILTKANIKALQLEEEVGLPFHLILPKVKIREQENKEEQQ